MSDHRVAPTFFDGDDLRRACNVVDGPNRIFATTTAIGAERRGGEPPGAPPGAAARAPIDAFLEALERNADHLDDDAAPLIQPATTGSTRGSGAGALPQATSSESSDQAFEQFQARQRAFSDAPTTTGMPMQLPQQYSLGPHQASDVANLIHILEPASLGNTLNSLQATAAPPPPPPTGPYFVGHPPPPVVHGASNVMTMGAHGPSMMMGGPPVGPAGGGMPMLLAAGTASLGSLTGFPAGLAVSPNTLPPAYAGGSTSTPIPSFLGSAAASRATPTGGGGVLGAGSSSQAGTPSNAARSAQRSAPNGKSLFVTKLDRSVDFLQLREIFSRFGKIISTRVLFDAVTGQSRGIGYVNFERHEDATQALDAMQGARLQPTSQPLTIKLADEDASFVPEETNKVFARNLPNDITIRKVQAVFSRFGDVLSATVHRDAMVTDEHSKHALMTYVSFASVESAVAAVAELNGQIVFEGATEPLFVKLAETSQSRKMRINEQQHGQQQPLPTATSMMPQQQHRSASFGSMTPVSGPLPPSPVGGHPMNAPHQRSTTQQQLQGSPRAGAPHTRGGTQAHGSTGAPLPPPPYQPGGGGGPRGGPPAMTAQQQFAPAATAMMAPQPLLGFPPGAQILFLPQAQQHIGGPSPATGFFPASIGGGAPGYNLVGGGATPIAFWPGGGGGPHATMPVAFPGAAFGILPQQHALHHQQLGGSGGGGGAQASIVQGPNGQQYLLTPMASALTQQTSSASQQHGAVVPGNWSHLPAASGAPAKQ